LKSVFIIAIVAVAMVGVMVPTVFAADAGISLTATTEYDSNIISITGFSTNISATDVEFRVVAPNGVGIIEVDQVTSDLNCEFSKQFNVSNWEQDGMYKITASHGTSLLYKITLYVEVVDGLTLGTSTSDSTIVPQFSSPDITSDRLLCSKISNNSTGSQTLPTDQGTLDVKISYDDVKTGQLTKLPIEFINPMTQKTQVHIDYRITIAESGKTLFQTPNLVHTSEGIINGFKFEFPQDGLYNIQIDAEGILFTPIPKESVTFDILVGEYPAQPSTSSNNNALMIDKIIYNPGELITISGVVENSQKSTQVKIFLTNPDGTNTALTIYPNNDGEYSTVLQINSEYELGEYSILSSYGSKILGKETFSIQSKSQNTYSVPAVAAAPTGVSHEFELDFIESADFRTLAFNALPEEEGNNPQITVNSGDEVTITTNNAGMSFHAFGVVSNPDVFNSVVFDSAIATTTNPLKPGESGSTTFTAGAPGTYYYICTVPGHALQGMVGNFIVSDSNNSITPTPEPIFLGIASFVDQSKDPQHYIDRYNNEPTYKQWFDENYPQYSSIYEAVGLEESIVVKEESVEVIEESVEVIEESVEVIEESVEVIVESIVVKEVIVESIVVEEVIEEGGGCLIATATYGSEMANEVQQLRELRDNQLLNTESGTAFMGTFNDVYYSFSPIIADYERENPYFKEAVKIAITPMISSLSLMENANSESEVLGIGISVIMLNLGMYLGVPAIVVVGIRKRF
jgi:nitrite reductase (NO-forming)